MTKQKNFVSNTINQQQFLQINFISHFYINIRFIKFFILM